VSNALTSVFVNMARESAKMNAFAKKHPRLFKKYRAERRECSVHATGSRAHQNLCDLINEKDPAKRAELHTKGLAFKKRYEELGLLMCGRKS
jgi:hypothetical protein